MKISPWVKLKLSLWRKFGIDISELVRIAKRMRVSLQLRRNDNSKKTEMVLDAKKDLKIALTIFISLFAKYLKDEERTKFNENYGIVLRLLDEVEESTIQNKLDNPTLIKTFANEIEPNIENIRLVLANAERVSSNKADFLKETYKLCYSTSGIFGAWTRMKRAGVKIESFGKREKGSEGMSIKPPSEGSFDEEALEGLRESGEGLEE